jgi:hypothetical protein
MAVGRLECRGSARTRLEDRPVLRFQRRQVRQEGATRVVALL